MAVAVLPGVPVPAARAVLPGGHAATTASPRDPVADQQPGVPVDVLRRRPRPTSVHVTRTSDSAPGPAARPGVAHGPVRVLRRCPTTHGPVAFSVTPDRRGRQRLATHPTQQSSRAPVRSAEAPPAASKPVSVRGPDVRFRRVGRFRIGIGLERVGGGRQRLAYGEKRAVGFDVQPIVDQTSAIFLSS